MTWANELFLTQIRDDRWNPEGSEVDEQSNNCGPASVAMLMAARGLTPPDLTPEQAIDHARALMHPDYPDIDADSLPASARTYRANDVLLLDDDSTAVFYDLMESELSVPRAIEHLGGVAVFGSEWSDLDTMLAEDGMAIAYGHISKSWRDRFQGDYGAFGDGQIPHFVAVFSARAEGGYVVCDPMHRGGAVVMERSSFGTFFRSPANVFDSTIRLIGWK